MGLDAMIVGFILVLAALLEVQVVQALGQDRFIVFDRKDAAGKTTLPLVENGNAATLVVCENDYPGVLRTAQDLSTDFSLVTSGALPLSTNNCGKLNATSPTIILAGTLGHSILIDRLVSTGRLNVSSIQGKWETFAHSIVRSPFPGVSSALVIAGSDKRGTIFGLYEISEQLGVSPWGWWADVVPPVTNRTTVYYKALTQGGKGGQGGVLGVQGPPSIKYRGIFLNDEQPCLTNWVNSKYAPLEYGPGFGHEFYERVFVLLLRLKANFLWPAQWNSMFGADDPHNQEIADSYGIVMSTSHTEPMMRATKEWTVFGNGSWDYTTNSANIYPFWVEGVKRGKDYEGVWTIGMRGNGDVPLSSTVQTPLLESIVSAQRQIFMDVFQTDAEGVTEIPQVWCLYKDVQYYYEAGMRVPDDVTLLWTDDNYGNVRRLPTDNETSRVGGAGMYYHFDYVGDPRDFKWINTIQHQKTWEQLHLTYARQARQIWVVNVGDLKGLEMPIDYYLNLAYSFDVWGPINRVHEYELAWAAREFTPDPSLAAEIADIVDQYGFLAARRKYELLDPGVYSVVNYDEAETVLGLWKTLTSRAEKAYDALSTKQQPSFWEMVLHPIKAGYTVYDIHISAAKNNLYASQRRNAANSMAQHVLERFKDDDELKQEFHSMLDGKWVHMMDQTHLGYSYWQQPMRDTLPPLSWVQITNPSLAGAMGVAVEGSNGTVPGDDQYNAVSYSNNTLVLPPLDPYSPVSTRYIEIFARGTKAFTFHVAPRNPWVKVSPSTGRVDPADPSSDTRVLISVDWSSAPKGRNIAFINITLDEDEANGVDYGNFGAPQVNLPVNFTVVPEDFYGLVESDGYVAVEAEHATRGISASSSSSPSNSSTPSASYSLDIGKDTKPYFEVIKNYGRTLSGVTMFPVLASIQSPSSASSPVLEYDMYLFTPSLSSNATKATVTLYLSAAWNQNPERPLAYAVAFDDASPKTVEWIPAMTDPIAQGPPGWAQAVSDGNVWKSATTHSLSAGAGDGEGAKYTLKVWLVEPGVVLQKVVVDLGGVRQSYLGPIESMIVGRREEEAKGRSRS